MNNKCTRTDWDCERFGCFEGHATMADCPNHIRYLMNKRIKDYNTMTASDWFTLLVHDSTHDDADGSDGTLIYPESLDPQDDMKFDPTKYTFDTGPLTDAEFEDLMLFTDSDSPKEK